MYEVWGRYEGIGWVVGVLGGWGSLLFWVRGGGGDCNGWLEVCCCRWGGVKGGLVMG